MNRDTIAAAYLGVLLLAAFNAFFLLGSPPAEDWDESRHGVSAYEMVKSGDYVKTTWMGEPDYWNLKPALGFWMTAASFKIFGFDNFGMRFPSALSAFLTVLLIMMIASRRFGHRAAWISGIALSTFYGFMAFHTGRTGDFDAQFTFFLTLGFFGLDFAVSKNRAYLVLAAFALGLAVLVKSFAAAPFLLAALVYLVVSGEWKKFHPAVYLAAFAAFALPVLGWGYLRYQSDGWAYIGKMFEYDLFKRSTVVLDTHSGPFFLYYFGGILAYLIPWSLLIVAFLFYKNKPALPFTGNKTGNGGWNGFYRNPLYWIWFLIPFLAFNFSGTKLYWYINPVYPVLALFLGWHIHALLADEQAAGFWKFLRKAMVVFIVISVLVYQAAIIVNLQKKDPTQEILRKNRAPMADAPLYFQDSLSQSAVYTAEVVCNYRPKPLPIAGFTNIVLPQARYFLTNTPGNLAQAAALNLKLVDSNRLFLVLSR